MNTLDRLPWVKKGSVFWRLAEIGEVSALSKEERIAYDGALRRYRDTLCVLTGAEMKGRAKGFAEGELAKAQEVARKLKAEDMAINKIAECTGLSEAEVAAL